MHRNKLSNTGRAGIRGAMILAFVASNTTAVSAQSRLRSPPMQIYRLEPSAITIDDRDGLLPVDARWAKVLLLSDGRLLFFDALVPRIWIADKNGKVVALSREGSGPGEVRMPSFAGEIKGQLWIYDVAQRRFSFFALPTLRHIRTLAWAGISRDGWSLNSPLSTNDSGYMTISGGGDRRVVAAGALRWVPVYQVRGTAVTSDQAFSRLHVMNSSHRIELPGVRSFVVRDQPFADRSLIAASPDGTKLVVVSQAEEFSPGGDSVAVFRLDGPAKVQWASPLGVARRPIEAPVLRELVKREFATFADAAKDAGSAVPSVAAFEAGLFKPRTRTPASRVLVDNDGAVLIRENDWLSDSVTYTMFGRDGKRGGRIVLPRTHHILAWRQSQVAVAKINTDGTERLFVATLRPVR